MEVIRQDNLSVIRIANSFKNSNTFVIVPKISDKVWLVDVGDVNSVMSIIGNKLIAGIFLTHAHLDHIYGIKDILRNFPNCIVYGSMICREYLMNDRKNLSLYYECPLTLNIENYQILIDESSFKLSKEIVINCFYTPGHTPDSTCYQIDNMIFTGDAYIPGFQTVTKLRGGDKLLASESIVLIKSKINSSTIILPGHGNIAKNLSTP